jgi:hypothetical protein
MPSDRFQAAAARAIASYPADVWFSLSAPEQSAAIYRELRKLDAESIKGSEQGKPPSSARGNRQSDQHSMRGRLQII